MDWYAAIMDSKRNPLRNLPPAQRFQVMVALSLMWTTVFCLGAGIWFLYGELLVAHVLVLVAAVVTALVFRNARRQRAR